MSVGGLWPSFLRLLVIVQCLVLDCDGSSCVSVKDLIAKDPCPVNGAWADWSDWSTCSTTCGTGLMKRTRSCSNPPPTRLGLACDGDSTENDLCFNELPCPINGFWAEWSDWNCYIRAQGKRVRTRDCYDPLYGGQDTCTGDSMQLKDDPTCHI